MTHCMYCTMSYKIIHRKCNVVSSIVCKVYKDTNDTEVWVFSSQNLFSLLFWPKWINIIFQGSNDHVSPLEVCFIHIEFL
jgi:hypothetical protein